MSVSIVKAFAAIGAKARVRPSGRFNVGRDGFAIDIVREQGEEIFEIQKDPKADLEIAVVDKRPSDRHLLLMVKREERPGVPTKQKFLCGHDEMHWFAATVSSTVADVPRAKESLKPQEVVSVQERQKGKRKKKVRGGVKRQGEWFFIPMPKMKVPHNMILKNEPIRREGGGKPHMVEEVFRMGGETVYESWGGRVLSAKEFAALQKRDPHATKSYRAARANAKVFGRGKIRHPDHSTVTLSVWHQIVPNTEQRSTPSRFGTSQPLRFID
jgi:hypothetical protein